MINQSTIDKLIEMRLTSMADAFRIQMDDLAMKEVPFEDRFGMLVDVEYTNRKNNRLKRLIRNAELELPDIALHHIHQSCNRLFCTMTYQQRAEIILIAHPVRRRTIGIQMASVGQQLRKRRIPAFLAFDKRNLIPPQQNSDILDTFRVCPGK